MDGWNNKSMFLSLSNPADTLILEFQSLEWWRNKFLLFRLPSLWYFIMAALANERTFYNLTARFS